MPCENNTIKNYYKRIVVFFVPLCKSHCHHYQLRLQNGTFFKLNVYTLCFPQTLTPHNKGLIRRAISQSGVALCPWGIIKNPREFAEEVGPGFNNAILAHNDVGLVFFIV